jgi:hypothetical protein
MFRDLPSAGKRVRPGGRETQFSHSRAQRDRQLEELSEAVKWKKMPED